MRCVWRESLQPATARLGPGVLAPNARRLQAGQPGAYLGRRLGAAALLEVRQGSHTGAQVALRTKQAERGQAARASARCLWQGGARMQVSASPNAGGCPAAGGGSAPTGGVHPWTVRDSPQARWAPQPGPGGQGMGCAAARPAAPPAASLARRGWEGAAGWGAACQTPGPCGQQHGSQTPAARWPWLQVRPWLAQPPPPEAAAPAG